MGPQRGFTILSQSGSFLASYLERELLARLLLDSLDLDRDLDDRLEPFNGFDFVILSGEEDLEGERTLFFETIDSLGAVGFVFFFNTGESE